MRNFAILAFREVIGGRVVVFEAEFSFGNNPHLTGRYITTNEHIPIGQRTRITRDFVCRPSSQIAKITTNLNNMRDERFIFSLHERILQGTICNFRINGNDVEILLVGDGSNYRFTQNTITKLPPPIPEMPIRRSAALPADAVRVEKKPTPPVSKNLTEIENKILEMPEIRLKGVLKLRKESLEEFLADFFKKWNNEKITIYTENSKEQTDVAKRRSLGDIFKICKYYYPKCTLQEVTHILYHVLPTTINPGFRSSFCNQIKKRVFYYDPERSGEFYNDEDEYGMSLTWWKVQSKSLK